VTTDDVFSTQPDELVMPETVAVIRETPNVSAVFEELSEKIIYQGQETLLVAGTMSVLGQHGNLQVVDGNPRAVVDALVRGQVAVSERFARRFDIRRGDTVTLSTPMGLRDFGVAGIIRDYAGPGGSLNIDLTVFDQFWPRRGSRDLVFWTDGDPTQVISKIRHSLEGRQSLLFSYGETLEHFVTNQTSRLRGIFVSVALMTALLGAVAISSLMLGSVTIQTRDRALLMAAGATQLQISILILLEGVLLGLWGGLAGIALGVGASYIMITSILPEGIGWTLNLSADRDDVVLLTSCVAVSSLLASAYPAWIGGYISPRELAEE
jgi:putative ABC transport system permease protein